MFGAKKMGIFTLAFNNVAWVVGQCELLKK
jgi:hypothetical protein